MTTDQTHRRKESRAAGSRMGHIKLGMFKRLECSVTDLSISGAKIHTSNLDAIPDEFELTVIGSGKKRKHKCVKRWQKADVVGVEFLVT